MKRNNIRISENGLRNLVKEAVRRVISEEYWPGDINPRVLQAHQEESVEQGIEKTKSLIERDCEELKKQALRGNYQNAEYYAKYIITYAKLLDRYATDKLNQSMGESRKRRLRESQKQYDGYVLVDEATEEILGNYGSDELQYAINDAKEKQGGRYLIIGCTGNTYDFNDVVFDTNPDVGYKF